MARRVGMSSRTFQRRFRASVGATPADWLARQRVAHACQLAETTDLGRRADRHRLGLRGGRDPAPSLPPPDRHDAVTLPAQFHPGPVPRSIGRDSRTGAAAGNGDAHCRRSRTGHRGGPRREPGDRPGTGTCRGIFRAILRRVRALTMGKPLIMGRLTYRSIEAAARPGRTPLPGRRLVVVGRRGPVGRGCRPRRRLRGRAGGGAPPRRGMRRTRGHRLRRRADLRRGAFQRGADPRDRGPLRARGRCVLSGTAAGAVANRTGPVPAAAGDPGRAEYSYVTRVRAEAVMPKSD